MRKEALAQVEARECHLLERFRVAFPIQMHTYGPPQPFGIRLGDVVFWREGDVLPAEVQSHVEEREKETQTWPCSVGCNMF